MLVLQWQTAQAKTGNLKKYWCQSYTSVEPEGRQKAPDTSGPQAPVAKLSRQWPFSVAIFCGGTLEDFFYL